MSSHLPTLTGTINLSSKAGLQSRR